MPVVVKLTSEEVSELKLRSLTPGYQQREEYDKLLEDVEIGDFGELRLDEEEQQRAKKVRTLLQHAATRKGIRLTFKGMVTAGRLVFEAVSRTTGEGLDAYSAESKSQPASHEAPVEHVVRTPSSTVKNDVRLEDYRPPVEPHASEASHVPTVEKRRPGRPAKVHKLS